MKLLKRGEVHDVEYAVFIEDEKGESNKKSGSKKQILVYLTKE